MAVTGIVSPPMAHMRMQVTTRRHVELFCSMRLDMFMLCLGYNLMLVLFCAAHAFLARKLPGNFNESWYLFVSVCTTSFLWVVFLPTYFTTYYAQHQAALLAFCLFVNGTCTLLCLFVPKVYAVYYVDEKDLAIDPNATQSTLGTGTNMAKVAPAKATT